MTGVGSGGMRREKLPRCGGTEDVRTLALDAVPEMAQIHIQCPNKHHFLVDLSPFGLDNPGEVFHAADRPYGLIQATVVR